MKNTSIKKSKIFTSVISLFIAFSIIFSSLISANAEEGYSNLVELANKYITKTITTDGLSETYTYTGIPNFVENAYKFFPETDAITLARFVYEYTGHGNSDDLPDTVVIETLEYIETTVQNEHLMITDNGSTVNITEEQAIKAISVINNEKITSMNDTSLIAPRKTTDTWTSSNGYMRIRTAYDLSKSSGNKRYYVISVTADWLKKPTFRYSDLVCISNTATYDSSYNDYAYYKQSFSCLSNNLSAHLSKQFTVEIDANGNFSDTGIDFDYQNVNGASALVDLKTFTCGKTGVDAHIVKMNYMTAYLRYRIICTAGQSYNIQGGYCHNRGGLGDPSVSFPSGEISFSITGLKDEYKARPMTINA